MNAPAILRWLIYLGGAGASLLSVAQFGAWDSATMTFDLYPFKVDDLARSLVSGGANLLAAFAVLRGWRGRK